MRRLMHRTSLEYSTPSRVDDVQLLDGEIAELNEAVTRSHNRSNELRARLGSLPAASGAGEFVAGTMGREADTEPPDEELVRAAKSGDTRARETLFERYTPMIVSEARSFRVDRLDFADLIQEGYVGLLRAIGQFDPEQRKSFAPFARSWIRQSLQELQAHFLRPMRLPRAALRALLSRLTEREREVLAARFGLDGHEPERAVDVAERLGLSVDRVRRIQRRALYKLARAAQAPGADSDRGRLRDQAERPASADKARTREERWRDGFAGFSRPASREEMSTG
jgi:DNA-directed RNA polymerase sigma subunit (sigma70/sigma32)